jgi:uncharacterized protein DUF4236
MRLQLRRSHRIAPTVRFHARRSSDLSTSFGHRGLSFTADKRARTAVGVPAVGLSRPDPSPRTSIRRGRSPAGGLLFTLFVIGLVLAAVALSSS